MDPISVKKESVTLDELFPDEEHGHPCLPVDHILAQFKSATEKMKKIKEVHTLISNIMSAHQWGKNTFKSVQGLLLKIKGYHEILFQRFAKSLPYFASLNESDKQMLITQNSRLYVQYILSHYLNAPSAYDQLTWLLGSNLPELSLADIMMLQDINLLGQDEQVAANPIHANMIQTWKRLNRLEGEKFQIPYSFNGLVAHYMLFSTIHWQQEEQMRLQKMKTIQCIEESSRRMLKSLSQVVQGDPQDLILLMARLHRLVGANLFVLARFDHLKGSELTLYERTWIQQKSQLFSDAREAVPVTEESMKAYFLAQKCNDHKSRRMLVAHASQYVYARCLHMIRALSHEHHEENLIQIRVRNIPQATMLMLLKSTSLPSALDQLRFSVGDKIAIGEEFAELQPLQKEEFHQVCGAEKQHEFVMQQHIVRKIHGFIESEDIFILALFHILTSGGDEDQSVPEPINLLIRKVLLKKLREMTQLPPEPQLEYFQLDLKEYCRVTHQILESLQ